MLKNFLCQNILEMQFIALKYYQQLFTTQVERKVMYEEFAPYAGWDFLSIQSPPLIIWPETGRSFVNSKIIQEYGTYP